MISLRLEAVAITTTAKRLAREKSKYMNPARMVADTLSNLHINTYSMTKKSMIDKDEYSRIEDESCIIFEDIRKGHLDFITDALAAHTIILNNIVAVCHKKARNSEYFKEYTELSIKASDQLRKSGLALAQIKNVIINIENLTLQQNNLIQVNEASHVKQADNVQTMVSE